MKFFLSFIIFFTASQVSANSVYTAKLDRSAYLIGSIEREPVEDLKDTLLALASHPSKAPISLFISSHGGSVPAAAHVSAIIMLIETSGTPVHCIGEHVVQSAAFSIFAACTKRYAVVNTTFMFHHYRVRTQSALSLESTRVLYNMLTKYKYQLIETLQQSTGMAGGTLVKALEQEAEWPAMELQKAVKPGWMQIVSGVVFQ